MARVRWSLTVTVVVATIASLFLALAERTPIKAQTSDYYVYSVKFVCGRQRYQEPKYAPVRPGMYATEINIHNTLFNQQAEIRKHVIVLVRGPEALGREPHYTEPTGFDSISLPPDAATLDDCARLYQLLGEDPNSSSHIVGFLELISTQELNVDAVYTSEGPNGLGTDIEVVRVPGRAPTN